MKSKILALSKNEDFKNLLQKKKASNKYVTIFYGILSNKNIEKLTNTPVCGVFGYFVNISSVISGCFFGNFENCKHIIFHNSLATFGNLKNYTA